VIENGFIRVRKIGLCAEMETYLNNCANTIFGDALASKTSSTIIWKERGGVCPPEGLELDEVVAELRKKVPECAIIEVRREYWSPVPEWREWVSTFIYAEWTLEEDGVDPTGG